MNFKVIDNCKLSLNNECMTNINGKVKLADWYALHTIEIYYLIDSDALDQIIINVSKLLFIVYLAKLIKEFHSVTLNFRINVVSWNTTWLKVEMKIFHNYLFTI